MTMMIIIIIVIIISVRVCAVCVMGTHVLRNLYGGQWTTSQSHFSLTFAEFQGSSSPGLSNKHLCLPSHLVSPSPTFIIDRLQRRHNNPFVMRCSPSPGHTSFLLIKFVLRQFHIRLMHIDYSHLPLPPCFITLSPCSCLVF